MLRARLHELGLYLEQLVHRRPLPETRFVIYAHYRTGSFLLRQLLAGHPLVQCDEEPFLKFMSTRFSRVLFPRLYVEGHARRADAPVYGCILREAQLERAAPELIRKLGWRVLHLRREDLLAQAVSNLVARQRKLWHTEYASPWRGRLEPAEVQAEVLRNARLAAQETRMLQTIPHLSVNYERDLRDGDHQVLMDRVFAWLGLPAVPVRARLVRSVVEVENAEELEGLFRTFSV